MKTDRDHLEDELLAIIRKTMQRCPSMIDEAILEGRIGLREMSEEQLIDFARDCYGITFHT